MRRRRTLAGAQRLTRVRRIGAMGGMLAVVGGLVVVRTAVAPSTTQALSTPGLAAPAQGTSGSSQPSGSSGSSRSSAGSASASAAPKRHHKVHHAPAKQQLTGNPYDVGYGIVQVQVTMTGTRITDVRAVSLPSGGRSTDISNYAAPQLRNEALSRQSARIDTVSGASYTSAGYARSLQSALDKSAS